jgi:hypothetical protein
MAVPTKIGDIRPSSITLPSGSAGKVPTSDSAGLLSLNKLTQTNMGSVGQQVSSSSGLSNTQSTSFVALTNPISVTITTNGRPVYVGCQSDGSGISGAYFGINGLTGAPVGYSGFFRILRDSTEIGQVAVSLGDPSSGVGGYCNAPPYLNVVDVVTAGTYTYSVQFKTNHANARAFVNYVKLVAFEL